MPHNFVVAEHMPRRSASWTSGYGILQATSLTTRPFLALRISRTDIGCDDQWRKGDFLFAISPQKPSGVNEGCYFTLGSSLDERSKTLQVEPPLHPEGATLYVHTFPKLLEHLKFDSPVSVACLPHQLEESSYFTFCRSLLDDYGRILQDKYSHDERSSGGSEPVGDTWHLWDASQQTEGAVGREGYVFKPQNFDLSAVEPPSIYQEVLLYNQLTVDYSWKGVTVAVDWALELRDFDSTHEARRSNLLLPYCSFDGNIPTFDENIKVPALLLGSMKAPFDGDPPISSQSSDIDIWDFDNEPYVKLDLVPSYMSPVSAPSTRVIAFDLFGTILVGFNMSTPCV
ncbi:hypothetical protein BDR04DRAFT_506328 [Suillus decipiens]|nr:hypothetical protein BDR04DRAFT_506328 [Suillus decipiens]